MLTYNDIYEVLRKEKYSEQLQQLPKDFLKEVSDYLKEKKEISEKKEDMFSDTIIKTKKQLENVISMFKEIMLRRKKKLLNLAFVARETGIRKRDFENMLEFEKEMFDKIIKSMEDADSEVNNMMNGKREGAGHVLVVFKEDVEEFLGLDGEKVGPFSKGEMANLPEQIVNILKDAGRVEVVEE
jgi:DNA replication initiation complex subunit (GINS family)